MSIRRQVKLSRYKEREDWFEPVHTIHTPLSPTLSPILFHLLPFKKKKVGRKIQGTFRSPLHSFTPVNKNNVVKFLQFKFKCQLRILIKCQPRFYHVQHRPQKKISSRYMWVSCTTLQKLLLALLLVDIANQFQARRRSFLPLWMCCVPLLSNARGCGLFVQYSVSQPS